MPFDNFAHGDCVSGFDCFPALKEDVFIILYHLEPHLLMLYKWQEIMLRINPLTIVLIRTALLVFVPILQVRYDIL